MPRESRHFVHFFVQSDAFLQVLELDGSADFGQDGEGVRIPLHQHLAQVYLLTVLHLQLGAVDHRIAFLLTAFFVDNGN